uniref:Cytochrome b n=1 Tax=Ostrea denselamellosa TaxID=74434 RepID=F1ASY4_9BIVA|nr:cytochrome b [Ostrea denselamellosa]ADE18735.1 cytochrome b [Ostrea denselamellosa]
MVRGCWGFKMSSQQLKTYYYAALKYPCPPNLNIWWNMGSMLFLVLGLQIVTGLFLSVNYTNDEVMAVDSVNFIMRDVNYGWAVRSIHMGGASLFFALIYMHIGRGVYYGGYMKNRHLWYSGVTLYLLSMAVGFLGYVLPWGVMSYWGLTVITNMVTVVPGGARVLEWFQGGYVITTLTLKRVFVLHFLLPFVILGVSLVHVLLLHEKGSSNPLGLDLSSFSIPFHPYYTSKDLVGFVFGLGALVALAFTFPKLTADPLQWQIVDKVKTPAVIKPEWYFLYAYAILRSIPHKVGGIILMFFSIFSMALLPMLSSRSKTQSMVICPIAELVFCVWVANFMFLTVVGAQEPAGVWIMAGQIGTFIHLFCVAAMPLTSVAWEALLFSAQE